MAGSCQRTQLERIAHDKACAQFGRSRDEIEVTAMWLPNPSDLGDVERYADLGVSRLIVPVPALGKGNPAENMKTFAENVISKVA